MDIDEVFERFNNSMEEPISFTAYMIWNGNNLVAEFETKEEADNFLEDDEMQGMFPEMELITEEIL